MRLPATGVHRSSAITQSVSGEPASQQTKLSTHAKGQPEGQSVAQPKRHLTLNPAEGWVVLLLLAIALYSVAAAIIAVNWVDNSSFLFSMPVCGLLTGLAVAKISRFPQSILHLVACLIGHWLAVWLTSAIAFHISWLDVLIALRATFSGGTASMGIQTGKIVFFFYLSFLCFFLGYFGCWLIYRAHLPWLVALVYCSIILVNLNYVRQEMDFLIFLLLGSLLLLIARMSLSTQIAQWRREGLRTNQRWLQSIVDRCMLVACGICVLVLLLSSFLPMLPQSASGQVFWSHLETVWSDLLTAHFSWQDVKALTLFDQSSTSSFGDQLTISDSVHLPTGEMLTYRDITASDLGSKSQAHYLEGLTYNQFDGHIWHSSVSTSHTYGIGEPLPIDMHDSDLSGSVTVTLSQTPQETRHYIFGPDQPFSFDVATQLYTDGTIVAWTQQDPLYPGEKYNVSFSAPVVDPGLLSLVPLPNNNPRVWIADRYYTQQKDSYLQLPSDLSPNVIQTARQWTSGVTNAYMAMKMLEQHFNDTSVFTYSLENQPIPPTKDVVDWLLQTHQGYCTYYATAMAIMGRQLGIPTRVVSGFSQGHFDQLRKSWVVDGTDAHSWVQAYLPNFGWVSFDPTPTFAPNAAPSSSGQATPPPAPTHGPVPQPVPTLHPTVAPMPTARATSIHASPMTTENHHQDQGVLIALTIGALILALLCCLAFLVRYWWRRFSTSSTLVSVLFWRFCTIAHWIGLGPKEWQTPYEYSSMLSRQFPEHAPALLRLTRLFVRERWGRPQHAPRELALADATYLWNALRSLVLSHLTHLLRSLHVKKILHFLQALGQSHGDTVR